MADDSGGSGPAGLRTPNGQPDGAASRADAPPTSGHDDATQPKKTWSLEDDDDDDEADANAPGTGGQGMALDGTRAGGTVTLMVGGWVAGDVGSKRSHRSALACRDDRRGAGAAECAAAAREHAAAGGAAGPGRAAQAGWRRRSTSRTGHRPRHRRQAHRQVAQPLRRCASPPCPAAETVGRSLTARPRLSAVAVPPRRADSEDRDYMQSLLAKDLELPAAKRAKPAPAPAPAAKPAEDDDEVDPLDGTYSQRRGGCRRLGRA